MKNKDFLLDVVLRTGWEQRRGIKYLGSIFGLLSHKIPQQTMNAPYAEYIDSVLQNEGR